MAADTAAYRECSYGEHCQLPPPSVGVALKQCEVPGCSRLLHHLCQGEYEGTCSDYDSIGMCHRCLPCLLKAVGKPAEQATRPAAAGETPVAPVAAVTAATTPIRRSPRVRARASLGSPSSEAAPTPASAALPATASSVASATQLPAASTRRPALQLPCSTVEHAAEPVPDEDEVVEVVQQQRKRGAQPGKKHAAGGKRVALSFAQQVAVVKHYMGFNSAERPTLRALGVWAQEQFKLHSAPSTALLCKVLKQKEHLLAEHDSTEADPRKDRKRKRKVGSMAQAELEDLLLQWCQHHDATHGGKVAISNQMLIEQAQRIAEEHDLQFDMKTFNFSGKWMWGFKKANNLNRMRFHGEGADADPLSVSIVRRQLPLVLADYPLEKIYNFDETGLFYRMLLTTGYVVGSTRGRKGGKKAKDRLTVGMFWNATGSDFFQPVFIGKSKHPRCFGKHWNPGKIGGLYYSNDSAWMRSGIWLDVLNKFNRYCYSFSNGGREPVILLSDNCAAHSIPPLAKAWRSGDLTGFRMTNVLVIFFAPNCTSKVQPLDAGCIQTVKALFRKRHMRWILEQLDDARATGEKAMLKCNVRQAMEWFMTAVRQVPAESVKNCWVATQILSPAQMHELATGVRHNMRPAQNEARSNPKSCVPDAEIEELKNLLSRLGTSLSTDPNEPVEMVDAVDLLDLPMEREVFDPPTEVDGGDDVMQVEDEAEGSEQRAGNDDLIIPLDDDVDVDEVEPPRPLTLKEAKEAADRLFAFVSENSELVSRASQLSDFNGVFAMDNVRAAVQRMMVSSNTRQASIRDFFQTPSR